MALVHTNSIAALDNMGDPIEAQTYTFVDMQGSVEFAQQELELLERPGVDGTFFRKTGVRGKPFQIRAVGYTTSFTTQAAAMYNLRALVNADYGVRLTKHSVEYLAPLYVLRVDGIEPQACLNAVGVTPGVECYFGAVFTLQAIGDGVN